MEHKYDYAQVWLYRRIVSNKNIWEYEKKKLAHTKIEVIESYITEII